MLYRFGEFTLCPERYELSARGERIRVEPRVLEVLGYLLALHDRAVPKNELLDQLRGVVVSGSGRGTLAHTVGTKAGRS
jgi:DNA-binding winged helix-turn-helix (wHTH) protein